MDVHSPKNGINRYWSIPMSRNIVGPKLFFSELWPYLADVVDNLWKNHMGHWLMWLIYIIISYHIYICPGKDHPVKMRGCGWSQESSRKWVAAEMGYSSLDSAPWWSMECGEQWLGQPCENSLHFWRAVFWFGQIWRFPKIWVPLNHPF